MGTQSGPRAQRSPPAKPVCEAEPLLIGGVDTGYARCERSLRRPSIRACPNLTPRDGECRRDVGDGCTRDADCPGPKQYCGWSGSVPMYDCRCMTGCTVDADCKTGEVCACGLPTNMYTGPKGPPAMGVCTKASCRSDADCGGSACLLTGTTDIAGVPRAVRFACATSADECVDSCADGLCVLGDDDVRRCRAIAGVGGRPLVVSTEPRVAPLARVSTWAT